MNEALPNSVPVPALPEWLRQAGYRTMHFGKGHLGAAGTPGADPKVFGFDVRIGGLSHDRQRNRTAGSLAR